MHAVLVRGPQNHLARHHAKVMLKQCAIYSCTPWFSTRAHDNVSFSCTLGFNGWGKSYNCYSEAIMHLIHEIEDLKSAVKNKKFKRCLDSFGSFAISTLGFIQFWTGATHMAGPVTTGHLEEQCHQPFGLGPRVRVIHTAYQCHCHHQHLVQFWLDYCMRVHSWPFHYHHLLLSKFPRTAVAVH